MEGAIRISEAIGVCSEECSVSGVDVVLCLVEDVLCGLGQLGRNFGSLEDREVGSLRVREVLRHLTRSGQLGWEM